MKRFCDVVLLLVICAVFVVWSGHLSSQMDYLLDAIHSSGSPTTIGATAAIFSPVLAGMTMLAIAVLGAIGAFLGAIRSLLFGEGLLCRRVEKNACLVRKTGTVVKVFNETTSVWRFDPMFVGRRLVSPE
ncbi:MAG: hypothetical protein ACYC48_01600 [Minisyncoccota bacterium]